MPQQWPGWSDGAGWSQPKCYQTIQLADIDGDGQAELIGRAPAGVVALHWNTTTHMWDALNAAGPLSDAEGWDNLVYNSTIQLADIDGDQKAELVARGAAAVFTLRWDATAKAWKELGNTAILPDADGFNVAACYSTIRLADIDGDGRAELVARSKNGLVVYHWNTTTATWDRVDHTSASNPGFLSDASGWSQPQYYSTLQFADVNGDGKMELVARGTNGMLVSQWEPKTATWTSLLLGTPTRQTVFSDGAGWTDPRYYATIQLADLDGDGQAELVGRGTDGLFSYRWDAPSSNWSGRLVASGTLSDAQGWGSPQYYSTILLADIDGDGKAELVARSALGLVAFRWTWQDGSWAAMGNADGVMADVDAWDAPQSYLTIQAADVDGSGAVSVIGRAQDGIQTWRWAQGSAGSQSAPVTGYRAVATNGFYQPVAPGFPDYAGTPSRLLAYKLISQYVLVDNSSWPPSPAEATPANQDVRKVYVDEAKDWNGKAASLSQLQGQVPAGSGISAADFEAVRQQLQLELDYVDYADIWFAHTKDVLDTLFSQENTTLSIVSTALQLPPDNDNSVTLSISSLAGYMISGMAGAFEGGALVAAVSGLIATALAAAVTGGGGADIQTQVLNLQQQLLDTGSRASDANAAIKDVFKQHWGLLQPLGQSIANLDVIWSSTTTGDLVKAAQRNYEKVLWQTLTPAVWDVVYINLDQFVGAGRGTSGTKQTPPPGLADRYIHRWQSSAGVHYAAWPHLKGSSDPNAYPAAASLSILFDPPNGDGTGPLGVPLVDVLCSFNGWQLAGSISDPSAARPQYDPVAARRRHSVPARHRR